MEYDLHSRVKAEVALTQQTINTDTVTDGEAIDTLGFESLEYVIFTGTITASGVVAVILEESDTGAFAGEESVVDADEVLGDTIVFADADDDKVFRCGSIGKKRYQRLTLDSDATTNGVFSAVAILGHPESIPVAEQNT